VSDEQPRESAALAALTGAPVGMLGGLIGLGGAEFRLPLLRGLFAYPVRRAVALNLAVSLVTLAASLAIRLRLSRLAAIEDLAPLLTAMVGGSISGAWVGPSLAHRISATTLERIILVLLVAIGGLLIADTFLPHRATGLPAALALRIPVAVVLGVGIGLISSLLGVAGGELIIPSLVFVFGADIILAGTCSVLISLPTVLVGIGRYAARGAYARRDLSILVLPMGLGSVAGALLGGLLVPYVPQPALKLVLGAILIVSAIRIFRHPR
jgi:uncharacterized membrane protein YfcA